MILGEGRGAGELGRPTGKAGRATQGALLSVPLWACDRLRGSGGRCGPLGTHQRGVLAPALDKVAPGGCSLMFAWGHVAAVKPFGEQTPGAAEARCPGVTTARDRTKKWLARV